MSTQVDPRLAGIDDEGLMFADEDPTVSVAEAAQLLGRDRTRVYALVRSGDLVAAPDDEDSAGPCGSCARASSAGSWQAAPMVLR